MPRTEKSGSGGGRIPAGSIRSGEKGSTVGTIQASSQNLFGADLYCRKEPFGADFYTRRPPFGGNYYCEIYGYLIFG